MRLISFAMPPLRTASSHPARVGFGLTDEELNNLLNNPLPPVNIPGKRETEFWYKLGVGGIDEAALEEARQAKRELNNQHRDGGTEGDDNDKKWK